MPSCITSALQCSWQRRNLGVQVILHAQFALSLPGVQVREDQVPRRTLARRYPYPRWRADRRRYIALFEANAFVGGPVNVWCRQFATVTARVAITHVIGQNHHHIRMRLSPGVAQKVKTLFCRWLEGS